jgi:hypothetical protein
LRPLYLPPDPADRTMYLAGEIVQHDFWFPLAEGRLGDEHLFRGAGEGARVGDRCEIPQMPQLKTLRRASVRPGKPNRFRL